MILLEQSRWNQLNAQERLDVLQTVCNIEASYLGLADGVTVEADLLEAGTLGYYNDQLHQIMIDLDHLERASSARILQTLLHEVFHSYEHRLADVYNQTDTEGQQLLLFRDIKKYAQESVNYTDGHEDYETYLAQRLEIDSRLYAEYGVQEYFQRIDEWTAE